MTKKMKKLTMLIILITLTATDLFAFGRCDIGKKVVFIKGEFKGCSGEIYAFDNITDREVICVIDAVCDNKKQVIEITKERLKNESQNRKNK